MRLTLIKHDAWDEYHAFRDAKDAEALYFESTKAERADPANAKWAQDDKEWIKWGFDPSLNGNWTWDEAILEEE